MLVRMGRRDFALERGGPKRIRLRWGLFYRRFTVALEGGPTWELPRDQLRQGRSLALPDGSSLFVRQVRRRWYSIALRDELQVEHDGVPVPGSDGEPRTLGRRAGTGIIILALLRLWVLWSLAGALSLMQRAAVAENLVLFALGVCCSLGFRLAAALAAGLLALELVWSVVFVQIPSYAVVQALIAFALFRAWRRMRPREKQLNLGQIFE